MKSITIRSQKILPNKIEVDIQQLTKNIKIVDASIQLKVASSTATTFYVNYTNDIGSEGENWGVVDLVLTDPEQKKITLNFSDELQHALETQAHKATFAFESLTEEQISFELESDLNIDYISLSEFKENGISHKVNLGKTGEAVVDLATGKMSAVTPLVSSDNNVLPFSISAHYTSVLSSKTPKNTGLPENWGLNIQQFLIKENDNDKLAFTYIDGDGIEQTIGEKYYYLDNEGNKNYLNPSDLTVDLDGNKKYGDKDVLTELESSSGMKLVSSIKDIPGSDLVDYEPNELAQTREQIKQYEGNKFVYENNIKLLKKQIFINCLSKYSAGHNVLSGYIKEEDRTDSESNVIVTNASVFADNVNNLIYKTEINTTYDIFNSYFGNQKMFTMQELQDLISNLKDSAQYKTQLAKNFKNDGTLASSASDADSLTKEIKTPVIGDAELFNIQTNFDNCLFQYNENVKKLQEIEDSLKKLYHQLDLLEMQIPVHYLYNDDNIIYGFGKTADENLFRLILITDSYENTIFISYKDFDSNQIECIQSSSEKLTTFEYSETKDKNQLVITDEQNRSVTLEYKETLNKVQHLDNTTSYFYYDEEGLLLASLNDDCTGAKFCYENGKVSQINMLSLFYKIEDENIDYKCNLDDNMFSNFEISQLDAFIEEKGTIKISYDNINSTTLSVLDGHKNAKQQTYIFDCSGNVRAVYCLPKDFSIENEYNYAEINQFTYKNNKVSTKTKILNYSRNFLDGVSFGEGTKVIKDALHLGAIHCGSSISSYQYYEVCKNYNTSPSEKTKRSVEVDSTLFNLLTNGESDDFASCKHRTYLVSGWAKADSAFILPDDLTEEEIKEYPEYIQNRKFEIRAEITYAGDQTSTKFQKSFDWRNMDWQYCAVPVEIDTNKTIEKVECFVDYTGNTGTICFTDLEFKEGDWESVTYDNKGYAIRKESAHSEWATEYSYDDEGKLLQENTFIKNLDKAIEEQSKADGFTTTYEYTKQGKLIKTIDYEGIVKENIYNDKGQVVQSITYHKDEPANKFYETKVVDEKGKVTGEVNELGDEITNYTYQDGTGTIATQTDENGIKTFYGYAPDGTLLEMTTTVDGVENTNTFGYTLNLLTKLKHNDFNIGYSYDNLGRNTKITIAGNPYMSKVYGEYEETTLLENGEIFRQTFDENGKVLDTFYKANANDEEKRVAQYIYDKFGNIIFVKEYSNPDKPTICEYSLNRFGKTYEERSFQHGKTVLISNQYDDNHENIESSSIKIDDHVLEYYYKYSVSPNPKLEFISLPDGSDQFIDYDKLGRLSMIELGNISKRFTYLKNGDHCSNLVSKLDFAVNSITSDNLKYSYDKKGNITEIRHNNDLLVRYKYDGLSRIVREDNKRFNKTTTFSYDAGGNITSKVEYIFTLCDNLDYLDCKVIPYSYPISGWRDQLMEFNGQKFEYDAIGNPITYRDKTLVWSHGRHLDKFGDIAQYKYNTSGIRTSKTIYVDHLPCNCGKEECSDDSFTTDFYLNGNKILKQHDCCNDLTFYYGADGVTGFHLTNNVIDEDFYYKKNAQNDIIGIYNSDGKLIVKYDYDAFGNFICRYLSNFGTYIDIDKEMEYNDISIVNRFVAFKNPFRYRSYYYDFETNLYYLNSRYYDPETGRFINADDISILQQAKEFINGLNLYVYCLNNPVNDIDKNGCFGLLALLGIFIASLVIGGAMQLITNAVEGKTGSELWRGVAGAAFGAAFNSLMLCLTMPLGVASIFISAGVGALVQTGVDVIETAIRNEPIDWTQTGINLGINFISTAAGNYLGGKFIPTNSGWFQPQKFISVFTKSYGQKLLLQTFFGSLLSMIITWTQGEKPKKHYTFSDLKINGV